MSPSFCAAAAVTRFGTAARLTKKMRDTREARVVGGPQHTAFTWLYSERRAQPSVQCGNYRRQHQHGCGDGTLGVSALFFGFFGVNSKFIEIISC